MQFIYIFLNMLSKVFKEVFKKFKELYGNSWKSALLHQTKFLTVSYGFGL